MAGGVPSGESGVSSHLQSSNIPQKDTSLHRKADATLHRALALQHQGLEVQRCPNLKEVMPPHNSVEKEHNLGSTRLTVSRS